jgi:hypothetical protein
MLGTDNHYVCLKETKLSACVYPFLVDHWVMSAAQVIAEFVELPPAERAQVARFVLEHDDSWIPDEFKQGMADIAADRVVEVDTAVSEPYPGNS